MAPFFFVFFGICLSDAGYGVILALLALFVSRKLKLAGMGKQLLNLLFLGGLSAIFFGVLLGSYFGDLIGLPALWFDPLEDPMRMLFYCFGIGLIHIYFGMALQAYRNFKAGHLLSAIFDQGFWFIFLNGLILLLFIQEMRTSAYSVLALGGVLLLTSFVMSFSTVIHSITGRRGRYSANTGVMLSAFAALCILLYVLASQTALRWDVTATRQFSLAPQTLEIVENLSEPILATAFFVPGNVTQDQLRIPADNLLSEFKHDPEFLANTYEKSLQALDDSGYAITPVSHYLKVIDDRELPKTPVDPPVLDGSWQPRDSSNMALWMGGKGQSPGDERDNLILTTNIVAGQRLRNVEYLLKRATDEGIDTSEAQKVFRFAMRELLLATVSDSTGWRPLITEVQYSVRHQQEALKRAAELATWLLYKLGEARPAHVDGRNKTVSAPPSVAVDGTTVAAPIEVTVTAERPVELSWLQHEGYKTLTVTVPATDETTVAAENPPEIRISIPLEHDVIAYTPALLDDQVLSRPLSSAAFASNDEQRLGLALPNGLLGLGPSRSLVLDQKTVHLAALIEPGAVVFEELTQPAQDAAVWVFRLYDAPAEDTLDAANSLNVYPPSVFE